MPIFKSLFVTGHKPVPVVDCSDVVAYRAEVSLPATLAAGDVIQIGSLPADHLLADFIVDSDDLDGGAALSLDFGVFNPAGTAISTDLKDGGGSLLTTTVGQGGGIARPTSKAFTRIEPETTNRSIGLIVGTAAATPVAGKIGVTVFLRTA